MKPPSRCRNTDWADLDRNVGCRQVLVAGRVGAVGWVGFVVAGGVVALSWRMSRRSSAPVTFVMPQVTANVLQAAIVPIQLASIGV